MSVFCVCRWTHLLTFTPCDPCIYLATLSLCVQRVQLPSLHVCVVYIMADLYTSLHVSPKKKRTLVVSDDDDDVLTPKRLRTA